MRATILPRVIICTKQGPHDRSQYGGQGVYCDVSTFSEGFLIFTTQL